jgi:uncharacterized DUF497 family protein
MLFEFDHAKSAANKQKHGIDFNEATTLWEDDNGLEVPAKDQAGERRLARVALIGAKLWFCVYTMRGETVRTISVRRARDYEKERYWSQG